MGKREFRRQGGGEAMGEAGGDPARIGDLVCQEGTRFNALEPIRMGLEACFGSVGRGAALGLTLRMDHGSRCTSYYLIQPSAYGGITRSFAFVSQPQGNGIAERFIKTLKQQSLYGRIFRNTQEADQAVSAFVQQYNNPWRIERLGFLTPAEARTQVLTPEAA